MDDFRHPSFMKMMMTKRIGRKGRGRIVEPRSEEASAAEWNRFYGRNDADWRSSGLGSVVREFLAGGWSGKRLLEIGCGLGDDIQDFLELGFQYEGIDLSEDAVRRTAARFAGASVEVRVGDFLSARASKRYPLIYDKGAFHGLGGARRRRQFARKVAASLEDRGIWITVCGAAVYPGTPSNHGAIFLQHLVEPCEAYFEFLKIIKAKYGTKDHGNDFDAWFAFLRRW